jgi:hypothetical protein
MTGALLVSLALLAQTVPVYDTPDLQGKLYRAVFVQGAGVLTPADIRGLPAPLRERLERYLERRSAFSSKLPGGATTMEAVAVEAKRRRVEGGIVALIAAPEIERLALEYAQGSKILNEWERRAAGPLAEAQHAEDVLKQNPSTPIAPYLYLFIAHRQRAAFETMNVAANKEAMLAASKKYRTFLQRARSAEDPIFKLLADDMDRQPFVYVTSPHHPRDFNPDT